MHGKGKRGKCMEGGGEEAGAEDKIMCSNYFCPLSLY